jgi:hypothetical protein
MEVNPMAHRQYYGPGPNPSGLCQCGCGQMTQRAKETDHRRGDVMGEYRCFLKGHHTKKMPGHRARDFRKLHGPALPPPPPPNPSGLCMCGCGGVTPLASKTSVAFGLVRGEHVRYIHNHQAKSKRPEYVVQDMGYDTPCHIWQRHTDKNGYGRRAPAGPSGSDLAHVVTWEAVNGAVPAGHHLHHKCRVHGCIRTDHLEPVTPAEHTRIHHLGIAH